MIDDRLLSAIEAAGRGGGGMTPREAWDAAKKAAIETVYATGVYGSTAYFKLRVLKALCALTPRDEADPTPPGCTGKVEFVVTAYDASGYGDNRSRSFTSGNEAIAYAQALEQRFGAVVDRVITIAPRRERVWP